jgi:hypothetical protein
MADPLKIHWQAFPGKQKFTLSVGGVREMNYGGARGGMKTTTGIAWLVKPPHIEHPAYRALVLRRNSDDLSDWVDRATRMWAPLRPRKTGKPAVFEFPSGAIVRCNHLKDREAYTKYQGHEYHKMLVEELQQIPREMDYLNLISACRTTVRELPAQIFVTCNPGGIGHSWIKARWHIGKLSDRKPCVAYPIPGDEGRLMMYVPATIDDNPLLMQIDPGYVKFLESLPEPIRSAWRFGDWDIFSGQVFELLEGLHIIDGAEVPAGAEILMTFDWGSGKPFSCGYWWQDADGRLYRFQELYGCGPEANTGLHLTDEETAERIVAFEKKLGIHDRIKRRLAGSDCFAKRVSADNGIGPSTYETFAKQKIFLEQGDCGPGSRKRKLDALKQRLRVRRDSEGKPVELPMLVVYRCCKHFTRTVPLLVYNLDNPEDVDTELEDHAYDDTSFIVLARVLKDNTSAPPAAARMAKVGKKKMF